MFDTLAKELKESGYVSINPDSLEAVQKNKVKLTAKAHQEYRTFCGLGAKMFEPA